jgi:hypothetical protein
MALMHAHRTTPPRAAAPARTAPAPAPLANGAPAAPASPATRPERSHDSLQRLLARAVDVRAPARRSLLQRELSVLVVGKPCEDQELVRAIAARLPNGFADGVWFHSTAEAVAFGAGTAEGMGVWDGHWVNLAGRGTIVFGEEHNDIREQFVQALRIRRRLVEGAWERSLHGVSDANIPGHAVDPVSHAKYAGDDRGKALENYWLRAGQYMARYAEPAIEALSLFARNARIIQRGLPAPHEEPWIPPLENAGELREIITTLQATTLPAAAGNRADLSSRIIVELGTAKHYADRCAEFGLMEFIALSARNDRAARYALIDWNHDLATRPRLARWMHACLKGLADAVEKLGHLQFSAMASAQEIATDLFKTTRADVRRQHGGKVGAFELWAGRREVAMLANLRDAMLRQPAPILVTIGAAHARNRHRELEELLDGRGCLVIGDITILAALGREEKQPLALAGAAKDT